MPSRKNAPFVPPRSRVAVVTLALLLAPLGASASPQDVAPPPAPPESVPPPPAAPVEPAPQAPAQPAPDAPVVAPAPEPEAKLEPAAPAPAPAPGRDEWADSGLGFSLSTLGTARFQGRFYEVGAFGGFGGPLAVPGLVSPVGLAGVHVFENRGYVTKFTIGMVTALAVAAAGNTEHVGSKTERYGDYTLRTDYYRVLTEDEMAMRRALPGKAVDEDYAVELSVYTPRVPTVAAVQGQSQGVASGFEFFLGAPVVPDNSLPVIFQWGFVGSYLGAKGVRFQPGQGPHGQTGGNVDAVHAEDFHYANAGAMVRLTVPVTSFAELRAQWDINALQIFNYGDTDRLRDEGTYHTSPFRLGAVLNVSDRFYGNVTGTLNGLGLHGLGVAAELGVRL